MPGKRLNQKSRSVDYRQRRISTAAERLAQNIWRTNCLWDRAKEGSLTEKNVIEGKALGLKIIPPSYISRD